MLSAINLKPRYLLFYAVLIIIIFTRFLLLSSIPPGMSNDEIEYALSSKTYALNGTDLSGATFPGSLMATETLGSISPVVPILLSPIHGHTPLTLYTARLPYILLSFVTAAILGYLSYLLFNEKKVALLSTILFLINPWSIFFSRFATESVFVLFFFLTGITLLIRFGGKQSALALLFFILGFFSYHGAKLTLLPIATCVILYKLVNDRKNTFKKARVELIFLAVLIGLIAVFGITAMSQSKSSVSNRSSEIIFLNKELLSKNVDFFRRQSIGTSINWLLINKPFESIKMISEKYLSVFSPEVLFLNGDPGTIHAFYNHGLFYLMDIPLILVGFLALWEKKRKLLLFFIPLILIAPISTAISTVGRSVVFRSFLLLPLLIMISSFGIFSIYQYLGKKSYKTTFVVTASICLILGYVNFLFLYFARLPVLAQENYGTSYRVLAKFLNSEEFGKNNKIIVITPEPRQGYLQTIFYSSGDKQNKILRNNKVALSETDYQIDKTQFTNKCPTQIANNTTYIIRSEYQCDLLNKEKIDYSIVDQKDTGSIYNIYNSKVCKGIELTAWNNNHQFSDYAIEKMNIKTFCQRWISIK